MLQQFQVPSILLGLFLRKFEPGDMKKLSETLPWRLPEFDGEVAVNRQLPQNAPADVPRVAFMSKDRRKVIEIAPAKLQFRCVPGELVPGENNQMGLKTVQFDAAMETFAPLALKVHSVFSEHYGLTANRIGVLTEFLAGTGGSANQRMHQHLLAGRDLLGERFQELQINALTRITLGNGRGANRWLRIGTIRGGQDGQSDVAMRIEADVNTLQEDTYDLSAADIEGFIGDVRTHLSEKVPFFNNEELFKS
ncbi:MAG: hypothetical protein SF028_00720 [Candidatus Sumerlaeia bacterium]|nr:hypothetical protein [Candidatus Sumerlaeia bacterium]